MIQLENLCRHFEVGNQIVRALDEVTLEINKKEYLSIMGVSGSGKSTLLNWLLNEDKAIVSEIAGTTRDAIEDTLIIDGFNFRFIDTAGIRNTTDSIENLGIKKSLDKAEKSKIILFLLDTTQDIQSQLLELEKIRKQHSEKLLVVINKADISEATLDFENTISISAKTGVGIENLKKELLNFVNISSISDNESIVTNLRHYEELQLTLHEIESIIDDMQSGISGDFLSINIRQALFHLGSITGEVTTDTLLGNIFGKFCIGK